MPNRLANETSPYLLQHQNNPVDWFPWGAEAFEKATAEDKPIFLSVGYSSCHWCHVMEHESFEDNDVAEILNANFVCVKVDREERPDVDEAYMTAVQLSSGRGGWPMSVFITPDKKPFFAGTYFPKLDRGEHLGFLTMLGQIAAAWKGDRDKVTEVANEYANAIRQSRSQDSPLAKLTAEDTLDECVRAHSLDFDEDNGGFGQAPKFPPHTAIEYLLNYAISDLDDKDLNQTAADMALYTLERMAMGGIHDHVGGGFHRYSTDERWLLPHFEKMLYDNALLLGNFARAAALCHGQLPELEALFGKAAEGIVSWVRDEMTSPEGLFYSAIDADSEGEEGKYYVWKSEEIDQVLASEAEAFKSSFQVNASGNFHDEASGQVSGTNILHLLEDVGDRFELALSKLKRARTSRIRPATDDKVLVAWNGLMIGALAESAELGMAERAAEAILAREKDHGRLPHQIAKGVSSGDAFLDDYAYLADSLITLAGVKLLFEQEGAPTTGRTPAFWMAEADRLTKEIVVKFSDEEKGGFYSTSQGHENLFGRSKPTFDQPLPSGNAIAAKCLTALGDQELAMKTLQSQSGWMERAPTATEAMHLVLLNILVGASEDKEIISTETLDVEVLLVASRLSAKDGTASGSIKILIPEGLHLNGPRHPAKWLIPTQILIQPLDHKVQYPIAVDDRYEDSIVIGFDVTLPSGSRGEEFELTVKFQACTESECQLPEERKFFLVVEAT